MYVICGAVLGVHVRGFLGGFESHLASSSVSSWADRPPGVRGAAAVGERGRGAGEHLQDPNYYFYS